MKKIVAVIPARAGSRGIKNKNMIDIKGFPLLYYSIETAKKSKYIQEIYISTDSIEIGELGEKYGAKFIFRPHLFAMDDSLDLEWVNHFLGRVDCDLAVHLRPTTPIRDVAVVDDAILKMLQSPDATSLRSAHRVNESPYKMFVKEEKWFKPFMQGEGEFFNKPRQEFSNVFNPNGYVDIIRPSYVKKNNRLHGNNILAFITEKVIELDSEEDLKELQKII